MGALAFLIALVKIYTVTLVLAQLEKEPSPNVLALGPTSDHDEQSITKRGRLESRDLEQTCDKTIMALRGPSKFKPRRKQLPLRTRLVPSRGWMQISHL